MADEETNENEYASAEREAQMLYESRGSHKEDRDILLVYKSINVPELSRSRILGIDIDNVTRDESLAKTLHILEAKKEFQYLLFLDPIKLMSMRRSDWGSAALKGASMILAEGGGLGWASRKVASPLKEKISTISYMMDLIRLCEKKDLTIFLLGSDDETILKTFDNLSKSFPEARIIGKHSGFFVGDREEKVKEAIRKTAPDVVFLGFGFPNEIKWMLQNSETFKNSLVIPTGGNLDILSGRHKKAPAWFQTRGLAWLWRTISKPWRLIRLWNMTQYYLTIQWQSVFGTPEEKELKKAEKKEKKAQKQNKPKATKTKEKPAKEKKKKKNKTGDDTADSTKETAKGT